MSSVDQTRIVRWIRLVNKQFVKILASSVILAETTRSAGHNNIDPSASVRMDGVAIHNTSVSAVSFFVCLCFNLKN